jgi:hypothetical protein
MIAREERRPRCNIDLPTHFQLPQEWGRRHLQTFVKAGMKKIENEMVIPSEQMHPRQVTVQLAWHGVSVIA